MSAEILEFDFRETGRYRMRIRLNMALPCRISVFAEKGKTKIGLIKPAQMLSALSQDAALLQIAKEVEDKTIQMINEAK